MNFYLKIIQRLGDESTLQLDDRQTVSIGRSKDNDIVLMDGRASRYHAHIKREADGSYTIVDGVFMDGELKRSANKLYVNRQEISEKKLEAGDEIRIGESKILFLEGSGTIVSESASETSSTPSESLRFDDKPLGHTQLRISAEDIIGLSHINIKTDMPTAEEVKILKRKEQNLEMLYELSRTFSSGFDLKSIFNSATDIIFRGTPADRVVAVLAEETKDGAIVENNLTPIAVRARDPKIEESLDKLTISRTVTQKVMSERIALLSQDASSDAALKDAASIVTQGVRSTICAPLLTESNVHGVIYADRLEAFSSFSPHDLELVTAVAAQMAVMVEVVKAHTRLAREEVARANYSRFMPENVVKQMLEKPDSFKLGGVNQKVTVLFADIRGFTSLSEKENPEKIVSLLNRYLSAMSEIIFGFGGTLDKYMGDGIMALFGAPTESPEDAKNALRAAIEMQRQLKELNAELATEGLNSIEIGIGLHTGIATVGYIGSERRSEYTAIGDTVNLAARLEQNASRGQILISGATADECVDLATFVPRDPLSVKNRKEPVTLFEVTWN